MPPSNARRIALVALVVSSLIAPAALAQRTQQTNGIRETKIANPAGASGASDNTTFSQDNRNVRMMAFDSAGTLVSGDSNSKRDVYVLKRGSSDSDLSGTLSRASVGGRAGTAANGDSTMPSLDGDQKRKPHCVAFQSTATNLDRGADRSSDSDVYVRDLTRRTTTLVSVGHSGARNAVVDGECEYVTYEAGGSVFVRDLEAEKTTRIARGSNPDQQTNGKGVAYERRGQVYSQAFQKVFNKGDPTVKKTARELLVSAGRSARGNGTSSNPSADDNGYYVAFESTATNLCTSLCKGASQDGNGSTSDVFRRTISKKAPTKDTMQMVSFSFAVDAQGNGASNNPAMTGAGENVAFDSQATNLRQSPDIRTIDPNGDVRDVYYWNFPRSRMTGNVSRESKPGSELTKAESFFNGPSTNPSTSNRANFIAFTSAQSGRSGESNGEGIEDVFLRFLGGGPEESANEG